MAWFQSRAWFFGLCLLSSAGAWAGGAKKGPTEKEIPAAAAEKAKEFIGRPYKYGGMTPEGFDCSGLVHFSFAAFGVELPHGTADLRDATQLVKNRKDLKKGDILFFDEDGKIASHVALYLEDNKFIHAPSTGGKVRIDNLASDYWTRSLQEIRRVDIHRSLASKNKPISY